ncbi:TPA: hypothetical protein RQL13_004593 [Vibrio vulnificus]|nr:hypothetical protein [Vibrio vulnificus]HAS6299796.1 hypothetical protein [Vibrio vulnificus]HDY7571897.1 hypothetical protein [Vibrio vulnificus]HDY8202169.1 hypothetical protein [Vibrio vulnificus]
MDVDINMRKLIFLKCFLLTYPLSAEEFSIFETQVKLNEKCTLQITSTDMSLYSEDLSRIGTQNCSFIKLAETSLIHLERFNDNYVVLVESQSLDSNQCLSQYGALIFRRNKPIELVNWVKESRSCGADRERTVFEYFLKKSMAK